MIKRFFKSLILRIYDIALNEHAQKESIKLQNRLKQSTHIHESVIINKSTRIINQTNVSENLRVGRCSIILGELLTFQHGGKIVIGEHVFIGEQSRIWSSKNIIIGNRVLISHNVNIHDTVSHSLNSESRHTEFLYLYKHHMPKPNDDLAAEEIVIGDDVWIGFNVTILKGVTIGNKAIIGANTLIVKDVPAGAVVIGQEQKIIKYIKEDV